jgi:hypothetical protein
MAQAPADPFAQYVVETPQQEDPFAAFASVDEGAFKTWYADAAKTYGLNPNPDDPQQFYDYRAAFKAGAKPDASGHWPSDFKRAGHPNMVVGGFNAQTGERVLGTPVASEAELIKLGWDPATAKRLAASQEDVILANIKGFGGIGRDLALGAKAGLARPVFGGGDIIRRAIGMERVINRPEVQAGMKAPENLAGTIGKGAETIAEFALPGGLAKKAATSLLARLPSASLKARALALGGAEAASTYTVAQAQQAEHPGMAAALGGTTAGILSTIGAAAPAIQASAAKTMERLLMTSAKGDVAAERAVQKLVPFALDDAMLRLTKGRWARAVQASKAKVGENIGAEVAGPVGDEFVPTAPVIDALEALKKKAINVVETDRNGIPIGASGRTYQDQRSIVFNQRLVSQIDKLQRILTEHGDEVMLKQLVNMRRDWDEFVFSSKSFLNKQDLVKQYEARAKLAATDAIRGIIDKDPRLERLAELDNAYSLHNKLYDLIADTAGLDRSMIPIAYGYGMKEQAIRRVFTQALMSPSWRLMTVDAKMKLAKAIADDRPSVIRSILAPVVAASTAGPQRQPTAVPAP